MKLVQGTGSGFLVSCKSAEAEEMWLKRITQAVADCCVGEGTEAGVDSPVAVKGYCLMFHQFSWVMGKLKNCIVHSLVC